MQDRGGYKWKAPHHQPNLEGAIIGCCPRLVVVRKEQNGDNIKPPPYHVTDRRTNAPGLPLPEILFRSISVMTSISRLGASARLVRARPTTSVPFLIVAMTDRPLDRRMRG